MGAQSALLNVLHIETTILAKLRHQQNAGFVEEPRRPPPRPPSMLGSSTLSMPLNVPICVTNLRLYDLVIQEK